MSTVSSACLEVRLVQIRLEAEGILSYELRAHGQAALPAFSAGAHIDLHLPDGMVRSYSLVNDPEERRRYVIAVQREPEGRGGSAWLHAVARVGDVIGIGAPVNDFALDETARESIFICGGIGITPVMSMIRHLERRGGAWRLYYAARSPERAAFVEALAAVSGDTGRVQCRFESQSETRFDVHGLVRDAPRDAHLYCCGPRGMVDAFIAAASARPAHTVHYERFAASSEASSAGGFSVVLNRSGRRIAIAPGQTMLEALLDHGVDVQYACSAGVCGTCRTRVVDGVPDHRDDYLTDEEKRSNSAVMVCCSGSLSGTLVLDL